MTVQTLESNIVITIPNSVNFTYLQDFLNYLRVKSIVAKSQATDDEVDAMAEQAQADWWKHNKKTFLGHAN